MAGVVADLSVPRWVGVPIVGRVVVHLGGVPRLKGQEVDRVDVEGLGGDDRHLGLCTAAGHAPTVARDHLPGRPVDHLPPALVVGEVRIHLEGEIAGHHVDDQRAGRRRCHPLRHEVEPRPGVEAGQGELLIAAGREVGLVALDPELGRDVGQPGAVRVSNGVGTEPGEDGGELVVHPLLDGQGDTSACVHVRESVTLSEFQARRQQCVRNRVAQPLTPRWRRGGRSRCTATTSPGTTVR